MYEFENVTVDVNERDDKGRTLLHLAAKDGNITFIDYLLHNGADVHSKDEDRRTPLHLATSKGDLGTAAQLVSNGADIQAKDKNGRTPLHLAAIGGDVGTINYLIALGGDIRTKDMEGKTPVDLATGDGANKYLREYLKRLEYMEKEYKRNARSLPSITTMTTEERPEPQLSFCSWIRGMIQTADSTPSTSSVSFIDRLGDLCSNQLNSFLTLAITGTETKGHRQRLTRHQNVLTLPEILASRIDQFALDAIHNFLLE